MKWKDSLDDGHAFLYLGTTNVPLHVLPLGLADGNEIADVCLACQPPMVRIERRNVETGVLTKSVTLR